MRGKRHHHGGDVCGLVVLGVDGTYSTIPTVDFGDSCLEGAGGYCISLGFWWHIPFPEAVIQRTLKRKKDNKDGLLISINVLEFVTVVVNYCAALHCIVQNS